MFLLKRKLELSMINAILFKIILLMLQEIHVS